MSFYKEVPSLQTTLESALKFDTEPKAGSTNPVTSDGVSKANAAIFDDGDEVVRELDVNGRAYYDSHEVGKFYFENGTLWKCYNKTREGEPGSYTYTTKIVKMNGVVEVVNDIVSVSVPTFVHGGSSGGGSVTKTITLPHKYKNAFGGFISFIVRSSSSGLTRTVNWEYTVAGSGMSYEIGCGQTIVVDYETKVTMPFIVNSNTPFNEITIKFKGTSADMSIYDADVFFYAEEVAEP